MSKQFFYKSRRKRTFVTDENGSLTIFSLFIFIAMIIGGGMAIDFMRNESQRTKLQNTLDRAVLAAADLHHELDPKAVVYDYFAREGLSSDLVKVDVQQDNAGRSVSASASYQSNTMFLRMLGIDALQVSASGTAIEQIPNVEISLVLDISGSMRFEGRMHNLKPAAKNFVSRVLQQSADDKISINLIPYAGHTNPSPVMFDYLGGVRLVSDDFPQWPQDISNIVIYFDRSGNGVIDNAVKFEDFPSGGTATHISNDADNFFPDLVAHVRSRSSTLRNAVVIGASIKGGNRPDLYFAVKTNANGPLQDAGVTYNTGAGPSHFQQFITYKYNDVAFGVATHDAPSSCIDIPRSDFAQPGLPSLGAYDQTPHFTYFPIVRSVMDWGWCPEDDTSIQYARNDESELHSFIDSLRMHDGTGTHYAMKYALSLLDPASNAAFNHLADHGLVAEDYRGRPASWDDAATAKYVVLMTDGEITEQFRPNFPTSPFNHMVELQRHNAMRSQVSSSRDNVSDFLAQCNLAKANGVTVFTIAYEVSSAVAEREMQACASSPSHFFEASGAAINEAFASVAGQINQLRLTR
ncbi:pilus assembly protein TadG-related protein [Yoonia sp.]|uniref:pilus assembly protein TadG-related protein n=1 Tax=Yoonia sp. TaxID=2212373 RepID=UPI00391B4826